MCRTYILLWLLATAGCGGTDPAAKAEPPSTTVAFVAPQENREFTVRLIRQFGWQDLTEAARSLSTEERQFGAGILGLISGIAQGPNGNVYVLDRANQKIAVFRPDGSYERIILGRYGNGPGEFIQPTGLAISNTGLLAVLDESAHRVTLFDTAGTYYSTIHLVSNRPTSVAFSAANHVVVANWPIYEGRYALTIYTSAGAIVDSLYPVSSQLADLAMHGPAGRLGHFLDGTVAWAHASPGVWTEISSGQATDVGTELYPKAVGRSTEVKGRNVFWSPVATYGIGEIQKGLVAIYYSYQSDPNPLTAGKEYAIAFFQRDGTYAGRFVFHDSGHLFVMTTAPSSRSLFIAKNDPYPMVQQFEVDAR